MLLAISAVMPLTAWRYLKALPNLGLLFNVASRGGHCRKATYVCEAASREEGRDFSAFLSWFGFTCFSLWTWGGCEVRIPWGHL